MILSICIPSYNRFEKLNETVSSILQAKSTDFEVVVIDNCSPRDIDEYIACKDERLKIIKREKSVSGTKNVGDSILYGNGKYSLLLLDKDTIIGSELDNFIEILRNNDVCGGYCELNSDGNSIEIEDEETVEKFGFLSKHPSGNFYRIDVLMDYIEKKDSRLEDDPFMADIYLAYCSSKGRMMNYDSPLVCSPLNVPKEDDKSESLTYSKELGNIYYFPKNRNEQFIVYIKCLSGLDICKEKKMNTLASLYKRTIIFVSTCYRQIMKDKIVCSHYGHQTENVSSLQMIMNIIKLRKVYFSIKCEGITRKDKKKIERLIFLNIFKKRFRN